jgi:hypothetical protein
MKKIVVCIFIMMIVVASSAYAGIIDKIFEGGIETVVSITIAGFFAILGLFFKKALAWRTSTKEAVQIVMDLYRATRSGSPGGTKITAGELDKIIADTKQFGTAFAKAWGESGFKPLISPK